MKTKLIQTRITETLFKKLKEIAEDEERSLSSLIRIIVKKELRPASDIPVYDSKKDRNAYPVKVIAGEDKKEEK